ncbi:GNAT family N-acetyltransferase [Candidatus Enterococcus mansonii]|uniref:N-acetyltransferase domain-containing protein n=1 Tax=Candidatus Enterococcus mansonii TaxID=1834181 RepID=A0A242CCM5_9ENTE|nr:GNAT family N-acetyltransferase [Enterococcus sp. 4G2_DIV0659]OTO08003.1 hypothetical protein A5880_002273 [Enterococcus sp. 4G2_DIV0659]
MQLIKYKTSDKTYYEQTLHLRNLVLRKPLGKNIFDEDLRIEKENDFYGWETGNRIIATLSVYKGAEGVANLTAFAVEPVYQHQGYGRRLVTFLIADLKKNAYKELKVQARETARPFYEKCGFIVESEPLINKTLKTTDYIMSYSIN